MASTTSSLLELNQALIDGIRSLPNERIVEHCGERWSVSPFEFYSNCPACGVRIKLRAFSGTVEIEDVFDAVFEWMNQVGSEALVEKRREQLATNDD